MTEAELTRNSNNSIATNGHTGPSVKATIDTTFKANVFHVFLLGELGLSMALFMPSYLFITLIRYEHHSWWCYRWME